MSPVTDPSEEYFKDGLWGWVVNQWKKLIADAAGHLQVDVLTSGLPAGGATAANQITMIAALQLIDDLRNALNSIATDELDIVFDGQNVDVEVTQTSPADLCTANHGWDGDSWQKLPLLFGYSDRYVEGVSGAAVGAGNADAAGSGVDPGEIWVIQGVSAFHDAGANKDLNIYAWSGAVALTLVHETAAVHNTHYPWSGALVLKEGDFIAVQVITPGAGKTAYLRIWGYKMLIAE